MRSSRGALLELICHAGAALVGASFDIVAITKYASIKSDRQLLVTSTSIAAVLFAAGCTLQAVLAYRHTQSWEAALRSFLHLELAYQAVQRICGYVKTSQGQHAVPCSAVSPQCSQSSCSAEPTPAATTPAKLRASELAGVSEPVDCMYDSADQLGQPCASAAEAAQSSLVSPFAAALSESPADLQCDLDPSVDQLRKKSAVQLLEASLNSRGLSLGSQPQLPSDLKEPYTILPTNSSTQHSGSWAAARGRPEYKVLRMLKLVHFGLNLPQACLALIVYVQIWQAGAEPVSDVLIVNIVLGIATCAFIAKEYFQYSAWSLWRPRRKQTVLPTATARVGRVLVRPNVVVIIKRVLLHLLYFFTAAISIAGRLILYMFVSIVVKLIDRHKYLNLLMAFGVMLLWWLTCSLVYYIASKQAFRSLKCGYLAMAMSLPYDPLAGVASADPAASTDDESASFRTQLRHWWLSLLMTVVISTATTVLGILQSTICLLSRHDSIVYDATGSCDPVEYQMGQALAILGAADGVLFAISCMVSVKRRI